MTTFQPTPTYPKTQQQPLPTMYDLPSDHPEDPGLPDEFHDWQPQLLTETFIPATYPPEQVLTSKNLFIYYDSQRPSLYKRPDWFGVVGVPRLVDQGRLSYVFWQEGRAPTVVVELLSENTQEEDQGLTPRGQETPTKWEVYETILRIPYYVVFDGAGDNTLRFFQLQGESYKELAGQKLWIEGLQIGLGLWQGTFVSAERLWLRWYDAQGNWIPGNAQQALESIRSHWGIENCLHWVLDMAFREDESLIREGYADQNLAVVRHIALNLLNGEKTAKVGVKGKRLKAAWDNNYLARVLAG